jgi:hypothetical protein
MRTRRLGHRSEHDGLEVVGLGDGCEPRRAAGQARVPATHFYSRGERANSVNGTRARLRPLFSPLGVSSNVLYIYPLYPSFTVFSKRFHPLYLNPLKKRSLNHVLYM